MDVTGLVQTAIITKLKANAGLVALIGGAGNERIYELQAPAKTPYPFVLISVMAGGDTNVSPRREFDLEYLIEVWSESGAEAATIAGYVDDSLHEQVLSLTGWTAWRCHSNTQRATIENDQGRQIWRKGAIYMITVAQDS